MLDNAVIFKISIDNLLLSHHGENICPGKKGGNLLSNNLSTSQLVEEVCDNSCFQSIRFLGSENLTYTYMVLKKVLQRKLVLHIYNIVAFDGVKFIYSKFMASIVEVFIPNKTPG